MDPLEEQLAALQLLNNTPLTSVNQSPGGKKIGPAVPPKPNKKPQPQVPKSCTVKAACEPSYSTLLQNNIPTDQSMYSNILDSKNNSHTYSNVQIDTPKSHHDTLIYSNIMHPPQRDGPTYSNVGQYMQNEDLPPPPLELQSNGDYVQCNIAGNFPPPPSEEDLPPPPSPVSSSYSELRRATDLIYQPTIPQYQPNDYATYGPSSQSSSTYESIYEPIHPRPPSQLSSRSNYSLYAPYVGGSQSQKITSGPTKEVEVDALTDLLVQSLDGSPDDQDIYGICVKCGDRVVGESSGCTAMEQVYHISCFTCCHCAINLQGKPFYALDGKPYCEEDYLNTLEKCSVCMKPILDRILRATGKPYHPSCFSCIVCGKSLDGIPFTVDATNQIHCIEDFHRKFAPRCCVCRLPIMPEAGQDETVRVVALDRSFHIACYKCEDCGLVLSSEADGRGCYPLDDHVLCKSCNAKRVQTLTTHMTTEL